MFYKFLGFVFKVFIYTFGTILATWVVQTILHYAFGKPITLNLLDLSIVMNSISSYILVIFPTYLIVGLLTLLTRDSLGKFIMFTVNFCVYHLFASFIFADLMSVDLLIGYTIPYIVIVFIHLQIKKGEDNY